MMLWPFKLALKILSLLLSALLIYLSINFVIIWWTGRENTTNNAQAILVFGTAAYDGRPSPELADRLNHALTLWFDERAPYIAVTGGKLSGDVYTEARVSAIYLESKGVPADKILLGGGADTWENVATVLPELKRHSISVVIAVTDPFHEYRAMATANAQGLTSYPSPVTSSAVSGASLWKFYAKETLEVSLARIVGYHTLSNWLHSD